MKSLLLALLLLLAPAAAIADVEGNPDLKPSLAIQFGKAWGYTESIDELLHDVIPGTGQDLDGTRVATSFRLPVHRSMTAELGYVYDGSQWTWASIAAHTRTRVHLLSATFRFYF